MNFNRTFFFELKIYPGIISSISSKQLSLFFLALIKSILKTFSAFLIEFFSRINIFESTVKDKLKLLKFFPIPPTFFSAAIVLVIKGSSFGTLH